MIQSGKYKIYNCTIKNIQNLRKYNQENSKFTIKIQTLQSYNQKYEKFTIIQSREYKLNNYTQSRKY